MHPSTFDYAKPTEDQIASMAVVRIAAAEFAAVILANVPGGADQTYAMRHFRETVMWCNVAITREQDGSPRA